MPIRWRCREFGYHKEKLHENDVAWISEQVGDVKLRESLGTGDEREALKKYRQRIKEVSEAPDPSKESRAFRRLTIPEAIAAYIDERLTEVSPGQIKSWKTTARSLAKVLGEKRRLESFTAEDVTAYKKKRVGAPKENGKGTVKAKSVVNELSTFRLLLERAGLWLRFQDRFEMPLIRDQRQGRALRDEEQVRLFQVAQSKPKYRWVYVMLVLGYYCGMRPCECLGLKWSHVHLDDEEPRLEIHRSKTPAGWRDPSLNSICVQALRMLLVHAQVLGIAEPNHFVFPYHPRGRFRNNPAPLDPTRPMTKYARQWEEIRKLAGLDGFWFYDGRHTARTKMAEMGCSDEVMDAQMGHVSKRMGERYSHIRREALKRAAKALEPSKTVKRKIILNEEVDDHATIN